MTIDQAIERLKVILKNRRPFEGGDGNDSIRLGIEALKRLQGCRPYCQFDPEEVLPGETKE